MVRFINYSFLCFLIISLGITAFKLYLQPIDYPKHPRLSEEPIISESMHNVKAWRFDKQGHKIQSLSMISWHQYLNDHTIHMQAPAVKIINDDGSIWTLNAKVGKGYQAKMGEFDKIELHQNVVLTQILKNNQHLLLTTEQLNYMPHQQQALTHKPVHVTHPQMTLVATGMLADLNKKQIDFSGKVISTYEKKT